MAVPDPGNAPIDYFYVVRFASAHEVEHALRPLVSFVSSDGGSVRLDGPDRVVVLRDGATLYLSPGAISLASYLRTAASGPVLAYLHGPEITPTPGYVPTRLVSSERVAAGDVPGDLVLMVGRAES